MLRSALKELFARDLDRLAKEISAYKIESNLWLVDQDILNSAGNLCYHLIGNLKTFIGANLGNTGYVRDRPSEFNSKNIPREELLKGVEEVKVLVEKVLLELSDETLEKEYPVVVFDKPMNTTFFLVHLAGHLNYHLGQVNYHRRLLDK